MQVLQGCRVRPRGVEWAVGEKNVLAVVAAAPLLLLEKKPPEIPPARVSIAAANGRRSGADTAWPFAPAVSSGSCINHLMRLHTVELGAVCSNNLDPVFVFAVDYLRTADIDGQLIRAKQGHALKASPIVSTIILTMRAARLQFSTIVSVQA
ncbi:hypothetical protein KGO5_04691 [Sinorhizobium sp. KGO-5]|uniref:hypothetical protein n=1 Tax=Sinorhizobium sp. KGO-5 TaxID=1470810 RepID=UPI002949B41F|nr:hypothetical protein KGO5_04691 [Sinorhizobium sp. KGO-5]